MYAYGMCVKDHIFDEFAVVRYLSYIYQWKRVVLRKRMPGAATSGT